MGLAVISLEKRSSSGNRIAHSTYLKYRMPKVRKIPEVISGNCSKTDFGLV
jgi:hypothetical protein